MSRGSIRRRGKASHELKWDVPNPGGPRKTKTLNFRGSKKDAERKLVQLLRERDTGSAIDPTKLTVGEYLDTWVRQIRVQPTTRQRYTAIIDYQVKPHIGGAILQELTTAAVMGWHETLHKRGTFKGRPLSD